MYSSALAEFVTWSAVIDFDNFVFLPGPRVRRFFGGSSGFVICDRLAVEIGESSGRDG